MLVLLLDTNTAMWEQLRRNGSQKGSAELSRLSEANFVQQALLFLNAYLMLQEGNKATVFAVDGSGRCACSSIIVLLELDQDTKLTTCTLQSSAVHASSAVKSVQIQATCNPVSSSRSAPEAATALGSQPSRCHLQARLHFKHYVMPPSRHAHVTD